MSEGGGWLSSVAAIGLSVLPGWLVFCGTALWGWLYERTAWSTAPFGVGVFAAIALLRLGERTLEELSNPEDVGKIPWFSRIAAEFYLSRAYLARRAGAVGLPANLLIIVAWVPWWLMCGYWCFLATSVMIDYI